MRAASPIALPGLGLLVMALCGLALLAGGCGQTDDQSAAAGIELGTGSYRFELLEDGQQLELVRGAQGGWHVWLSLRAQGAALAGSRTRFVIQEANGPRVLHEEEVALRFDRPDADGRQALIGHVGVVRDPGCAVGKLMRVQGSVALADGTTLHAERDVMVAGGESPPPACE